LRDPQTWSARAYLDEWLALARAVAARVSGAKFGMPDVASRVEWLTEIAALWPTIQDPPHVTTLTHHYYFGGPATNPDVNIANLMAPATMAKVQKTADTATSAAARVNDRVRMTEGNTCYRGGKPGVSDVFASALWSADYSLLLASNNYSGVNLHGGTGKSVANSVGGSLPGDGLLEQQGATPSQIATYPHPFYTPIGTFGSEYRLQPVARGLQLAGAFCGGRLFKGDFTAKLQTAGINATSYAAELPGGKRSIIILNKDLERDLEVTINFGRGSNATVEKQKLVASVPFHRSSTGAEAAAIDSRDALFSDPVRSNLADTGRYRVSVPHASAVRITRS